MKKTRLILAALIVFCTAPLPVYAAPKTYLSGKLLSIQSPEVLLPIPLGTGQSMQVPIHPTYQFEIQQGDLVYIGYCQNRDYKSEWHVGDDVLFRLKKNNLYLKRPNGKEFRLGFLLEAKLGLDGKPVTVLSQGRR